MSLIGKSSTCDVLERPDQQHPARLFNNETQSRTVAGSQPRRPDDEQHDDIRAPAPDSRSATFTTGIPAVPPLDDQYVTVTKCSAAQCAPRPRIFEPTDAMLRLV
jgi:hypothetical protein